MNKKIQKCYICVVLLVLMGIFITSCEKSDDSVIDPNLKSPILTNPYKSKDTVFTTSTAPVINLFSSVSVNQNEGGSIKSVTCKVLSPQNSVLATYTMSDDGILPDSVAGDSRYSCTINITNISCLLVGQYTIQLLAENSTGLLSNQINSSFYVVMTNNQAPIVSGLFTPDSIAIPVSGSNISTLSVFTLDSNGYCDIKRVFFNSYRPDSTITGGSPFTMYDDGNILEHGDTTARDGRFSLIIQIASTQTIIGWYTFKYQAEDNSGLLSNQLIGRIYIYRP
ncbi:MAG: hypothetical protein NTU73_03855 [Ignavibacteriae bacterium]|nr:hypothetical protein [Ignavibacteriota bacterium]